MFQARASIQAGLLPLAMQRPSTKGVRVTKSPETATMRTNPALSRGSVTHELEKILVRFEPGGIRRQALRASRVIQRNHLVHCGVQGVAFAIAPTRLGGGRISRDLRDRQIVASPHHNSAGMERTIKPQSNFSRDIAEAKSKFRREHHWLSHRRIGKCFFPAPTHDQYFNPGRCLVAITIWKSKQRGALLWRGEDRKMGLRPVRQSFRLLRFL